MASATGAAEILQKVTVNVGVIRGGVKVNMLPAECEIEADARLPVGVDRDEVRRAVDGSSRAIRR